MTYSVIVDKCKRKTQCVDCEECMKKGDSRVSFKGWRFPIWVWTNRYYCIECGKKKMLEGISPMVKGLKDVGIDIKNLEQEIIVASL